MNGRIDIESSSKDKMLLKMSSTHLCPYVIDKLSNLEDLSTQMIQVVMVECDIAYHCLIK